MSGSQREDVGEVQTNEPHFSSPASNPRLPSRGEYTKDYCGKALCRLDKEKSHRIKQALKKQQETNVCSETVDSGDAQDTTHGARDRSIITNGSTSWPDILSEVCRQRQEDHKAKNGKFRFAGRDVNLRQTLEN